MGRVYLPTWMVAFYRKLVGKYTVRPIDSCGNGTSPGNLQKLHSEEKKGWIFMLAFQEANIYKNN